MPRPIPAAASVKARRLVAPAAVPAAAVTELGQARLRRALAELDHQPGSGPACARSRVAAPIDLQAVHQLAVAIAYQQGVL